MSSDLLGWFSCVSEAWWEVTGLRPGHAPLLPLHTHQNLYAAAPIPLPQPVPTLPQALVFDTQTMILQLTSAFTAEIQKVEQRVDEMVRKAVAEAMIQSQYPNLGKPNLLPPLEVRVPSPSPPPPVTKDHQMNQVRPSPPPPTKDEEAMDMYIGDTQAPEGGYYRYAECLAFSTFPPSSITHIQITPAGNGSATFC